MSIIETIFNKKRLAYILFICLLLLLSVRHSKKVNTVEFYNYNITVDVVMINLLHRRIVGAINCLPHSVIVRPLSGGRGWILTRENGYLYTLRVSFETHTNRDKLTAILNVILRDKLTAKLLPVRGTSWLPY